MKEGLVVQKNLTFFFSGIFAVFIFMLAPLALRGAEKNFTDIVPVASEESLACGITVLFSAGMSREDTVRGRNLVHDADNLVMRIFRFRRDEGKNKLKICFAPPGECMQPEFSRPDGKLLLTLPGEKAFWVKDQELLRTLCRSMVTAILGGDPEKDAVPCDWVWNGLAALLELPGNEDDIWRVGYYYGLQDAFLKNVKTDWERLMMLSGAAESRIESELCRLLLETSKQQDTGSQRLLQDYVMLVMTGKTDNAGAYWSSVGFSISDGGRKRKSGLAALQAKAREQVFSRLSPLPAREVGRIFEEYGKSTLHAFDKADGKKIVEISGSWEDWPVWCSQYDMSTAAELMCGQLKTLCSESPGQILTSLDGMQQELAAAASGAEIDSAQWCSVIALVRQEIWRQQEIEAILFRLEERNPAVNERLRTRIDALQDFKEFPFPAGFEKLINETESAFAGKGRK